MANIQPYVGNIVITTNQPTPKVASHPWLYPYSGYSLGNSLRNCYSYSQYGSQMICSVDFPLQRNIAGRAYQQYEGLILANQLYKILNKERFRFSPWTHIKIAFVYHQRNELQNPQTITLRTEITGTSNVVLEKTIELPPRPAETVARLEDPNVSRDGTQLFLLEDLYEVSDGRNILGQSCVMNIYASMADTFERPGALYTSVSIRPISLTLFGVNIPDKLTEG